jgi:hypothetical protein
MPIDLIGAQTFIRLDGDVDPQSQTLAEITRIGVNGVAFKKMGVRGKVFQLTGIADFASAAASDAIHDTYRAMIGSLVTVRLNTVDRTNYLVLDVQSQRLPQVASAVGGLVGGNFLVSSVWTLVYGSV